MRRHRNAKIVATLGPASSTQEIIRNLFEAGADVFRLNFSHGTHEDHRKRYDIIRAIEQEMGRPIGVLADLQGPKLRLGTFADGRAQLRAGDSFELDLRGVTFMDSMGMRSLLTARDMCSEHDSELVVVAGEGQRKMLEVTGLIEVLPLQGGDD